jgi:DNA-binding response OmpR family regulator
MDTRQGLTDMRRAGRLVGARLLLVEDTHTVRQALRTMLELEGATVMEAGTGREAFDLMAREAFDLVLTDLGLPDIPGADVIAQVRLASEGRTAVAVLSGADPQQLAAALEAGAERAFRKPFDWDDLLAYIARRTVRRVA